jgi:hypothetical protein
VSYSVTQKESLISKDSIVIKIQFYRFIVMVAFPKKSVFFIPVVGCGGLYGCEMLRIPQCLDSRLTDGGEAVSLTHHYKAVWIQ